MSSDITQNKRDYFSYLAKKIYLTPSDSILEDCQDFLDQIKEDLDSLKGLDLSSFSVYYGRDEFAIPSDSRLEHEDFRENLDLLDSLVEDYEFTNIRYKDQEG